jgi:cytochrome c biogenesis protein CcdA
MEAWINSVLGGQGPSWLMFPAALLLGLISSLACVGCSAPLLLGVLGYAGSRNEVCELKNPLVISLSFMVGAVLALSLLGAAAGFIGQSALAQFGVAGKVFLAFLTILFGLAALDFLPVRLRLPSLPASKIPSGTAGSALFGLSFGAVSAALLMVCCGPVMLPVMLGLSALQGQALAGALALAVFAVGYSLPVSLAVLGIGMGKFSLAASRINRPLQIIFGLLLIAAGFWIILTL